MRQARSWQHVARKTPVDEGRRVHFFRPLSAVLMVLTIYAALGPANHSRNRVVEKEPCELARMRMDKERHFIHTGTNKNAAASAGLFINIIKIMHLWRAHIGFRVTNGNFALYMIEI